MKNLPKEQIFQLKAMSLDAAIKSVVDPAAVVPQAEEIYQWLAKEIPDAPVAAKAASEVIKLV